jgi:large subunit ribosomal protein L13
MKTYSPKPEHVERRWLVIDAGGQVLGRVASEAAALLRGKHKPIFAPHMDTGDNVIIVNADKVELTGQKASKKIAYRHSGYPGGLTATSYDRLMTERPVFVIEKAVRGMLPKNRLGRAMFRKLHVVPGPDHPHHAQKPVAHTIGRPRKWEGLPQLGPAPVAKQEAAEQPIGKARKPVAKKPPTRKPAARKPAARKPAAKRTGTKAASAATSAKTTARSGAKSSAKSGTKSAAKSTAKRTAARTSAAKKTKE